MRRLRQSHVEVHGRLSVVAAQLFSGEARDVCEPACGAGDRLVVPRNLVTLDRHGLPVLVFWAADFVRYGFDSVEFQLESSRLYILLGSLDVGRVCGAFTERSLSARHELIEAPLFGIKSTISIFGRDHLIVFGIQLSFVGAINCCMIFVRIEATRSKHTRNIRSVLGGLFLPMPVESSFNLREVSGLSQLSPIVLILAIKLILSLLPSDVPTAIREQLSLFILLELSSGSRDVATRFAQILPALVASHVRLWLPMVLVCVSYCVSFKVLSRWLEVSFVLSLELNPWLWLVLRLVLNRHLVLSLDNFRFLVDRSTHHVIL